eukprot:9982002-Lingulodinium_polyedra.AAC.1
MQTWAKLKCFSRRPRQGTRNIINVRWVNNSKWQRPAVGAAKDDSGRGRAAEARTDPPHPCAVDR